MQAIKTLSCQVGVQSACTALRMHRSTYYRRQRPSVAMQRPRSPLKLADTEYQAIQALLHSPRFVDDVSYPG